MSSPYVGEIRMFGGNFPPVGWAFCQGQAMPIAEYDTLFQLIGTTYGGDVQATFNLPNLGDRHVRVMAHGPFADDDRGLGNLEQRVALAGRQSRAHRQDEGSQAPRADRCHEMLDHVRQLDDHPGRRRDAPGVEQPGGCRRPPCQLLP